MSASFSGNDSDFFEAWRDMTYGASGTRQNKQLPPAPAAPAIPARTGVAPHVTGAAASSGGTDMTLKGVKVVTSSDGLITISYPQSVEVVVGSTTLIIPAISKTP